MDGPLVIPPPSPKVFDYPVATATVFVIGATVTLVIVARYFDQTAGVLTVSIVIVLAFLSTVVFCLYFTIPTNEATSSVIGGLTAAFGAIVAFLLGKKKDDQ